MRWPETLRLIARIKRERSELSVEHHASAGATEHYSLRIGCLKKGPDAHGVGKFHLVPGSLDTIYGPDGWKRYVERHPEPACLPCESYRTNAMGQEIDRTGQVVRTEPPAAPRISAQELLERIVALNRADPAWWGDPAKVAELAAAWGVRTKGRGVIADYEQEEVARLSGNCHASILIARTGSGLYACGVMARWGDGGTTMEPTVGTVPFDTEAEAKRWAFKELIEWLQVGRGAAKHQQRQLLLAAVKDRDRQRGLFG